MPNDDEGLASYLYAEADHLEATARTMRAHAVVLRLTHERAISQRPHTETLMAACQPLSLESATEHVPLCHRTNQPHPISSCLGCHPEGE